MPKMQTKPVVVNNKMWAIFGNCGLYIGMWFTRREAIKGHVEDIYCKPGHFFNPLMIKQFWRVCRAKGDRAIKVEVSYERTESECKERKESVALKDPRN